jgi:peptidoglycan/LPS O-acetylase OafA/YrhL
MSTYRSDIDGLRAIAVLLVIIFHAEPAALPGGFVGVDVFFVISGYLITGIISSEVASKSFSLASFYERRVRRIIAPLLRVVAASSIAAWRILTPERFLDFAHSAVAAIFFSSNIYFWRESGYFAPDAAERPLLHTWSLGIEEQFYILFPLALMWFLRCSSSR